MAGCNHTCFGSLANLLCCFMLLFHCGLRIVSCYRAGCPLPVCCAMWMTCVPSHPTSDLQAYMPLKVKAEVIAVLCVNQLPEKRLSCALQIYGWVKMEPHYSGAPRIIVNCAVWEPE
jgi:hypothetical protein